MGGSGIFRLTLADPNRNAIVETLTHAAAADHGAAISARISEGDKRTC